MAKLALAEALKKKKLSKRKFAKLLEIDYKNVFRLFHDDQDPKLSTLNKWAKILGVKVKALLKE